MLKLGKRGKQMKIVRTYPMSEKTAKNIEIINNVQFLISGIEKRLNELDYNMPDKFYRIYKLAINHNKYDLKAQRRLKIVKRILDEV
jgi:hypothetical protein